MNQAITLQANIPDELIDCIVNRVIDKLKPLLSVTPKEAEAILDVKGLADYLKTTEAWVRDQARNGTIPAFKSGKCWKFHKNKIDKHFQSRSLLPMSTATGKGKT